MNAELGVKVRWSNKLVHLTQDENAVSLLVDDITCARCAHVPFVGCDGGHSVVRHAVGAHFEGDDSLGRLSAQSRLRPISRSWFSAPTARPA